MMTPVFEKKKNIRLDPYFMPYHDLIAPFLQKKNLFVSITFSSRDTWT